MALTPNEILITDVLAIIRSRFNSILTDFQSFTFSAGSLEIDSDLSLTGDLSSVDGTFSGDVAVTGTLKKGGTDVSLSGHTHDDRYFTETEITTNHYTKAQTNTLLDGYFPLDGSDPITGDITQRNGTGSQEHSLEQYSEYTDGSNYSKAVMKVVDDPYGNPVMRIGVESAGTGTDMEIEKVQGTHLMREFIYSGDLVDDGVITLPPFLYNMRGWIIAGDNEERCDFWIKSDGTAVISSESSNVVANTGTDEKLCIGTSVANPVLIANRLGSTKRIMMKVEYY